MSCLKGLVSVRLKLLSPPCSAAKRCAKKLSAGTGEVSGSSCGTNLCVGSGDSLRAPHSIVLGRAALLKELDHFAWECGEVHEQGLLCAQCCGDERVQSGQGQIPNDSWREAVKLYPGNLPPKS